jgi:hypothetical protein
MEVDIIAIWSVLVTAFYLGAMATLWKTQNKLETGMLKTIVFWFYMFIVGVFLLVTLLVAMLVTGGQAEALQRLQILITLFILISGFCAIRLALLVLNFSEVYGK